MLFLPRLRPSLDHLTPGGVKVQISSLVRLPCRYVFHRHGNRTDACGASPVCMINIASGLSKLVAKRIAPDTHLDQACREVTHVCPGGHGRPGETLVPDEVQGLGKAVAVAFATPVKRGSPPGRPDCLQTVGEVKQRKDPINAMAVHQSSYRVHSPCITC